jgi:hypothetical protein
LIENILFLENQYGECTNELIAKSTNIEKEAPIETCSNSIGNECMYFK